MTDINCDMGESFSIYSAGNDEEIMPLIDIANVACAFMLRIQIICAKQ